MSGSSRERSSLYFYKIPTTKFLSIYWPRPLRDGNRSPGWRHRTNVILVADGGGVVHEPCLGSNSNNKLAVVRVGGLLTSLMRVPQRCAAKHAC